jgi:uncharacterized protein YllA (UPF0747 family)
MREAWRRALEEWNAPPAVRANLDRIGAARIIVTGQQPGIWGGPLYNAYKAATAVALARRLEARGEGPAVPVFWVQGEDTDWDEAGWGALPRADLRVTRVRWPAPIPARHWIGNARIALPAEGAEALDGWSGHPWVAGPVDASEVELSDSFIAWLLRLFGNEGLVPLDGRWPELREAGTDLWAAYAPRHQEFAETVVANGSALDREAADHGLFLLDGDRREPIDAATWEDEVGERLASGRGASLAPSVLLRAVLQDHLLGTSVQVVGAGEEAYLRQLEPLFRALEVRPAARVPRFRATLTPPGLLPKDALPAAMEDPETWLADLAASRVPDPARAAIENLRRGMEQEIAALVEAAPGGDLNQLAESTRRKMDGQIHRLAEALDRRARQSLYQETPAFRNLPEFLRPRRGEQERGLSASTLALLFPRTAPEALLEGADAHLDTLEGGELHHHLLEGERV